MTGKLQTYDKLQPQKTKDQTQISYQQENFKLITDIGRHDIQLKTEGRCLTNYNR